MIARAFAMLRRDPLLAVLLLAAIALPPVLGLVPLGRALVPLLDLHPVARALTEGTLDDTLLRAIVARAPTLHGTLGGGVLVALLISAPAVWLIEGAIAGAALARRDVRWACGRGLGVSLLALVPRVLLGAATTAIVWAPEHETWAASRDALVVAAVLTLLFGALLTVLVDVARGHAVATERALALCFADAMGTIRARVTLYARLVGLELGSLLVCLGVVALTRPLGAFHGVLWIAGVLALALRTVVTAAIVAAAAMITGEACRSA